LEKSVNSLKNDKEKLEDNKAILSKKSEEMTQLKNELQDQKDSLAYEHENKDYLLKETKSSEQQYQALLQKAQREQRQAENDIYNAEQSIREKMSAKERAKLDNGNNTIAWPVAKNVIVAKFHDQDYPYRKLIGEHPAVDIRAKQGSTLMAAADGYVAKVKFDGTTSYAYIMIVHGNGLATVYGHVSAVYVMPGQYVSQGQKIGLSGGMPGGIGSGPFTTGPHLHFEVRLNGLPVDPELYLP
jgi:murein DD-endopeptidase MepM/ murein hydrolase activator NlpD